MSYTFQPGLRYRMPTHFGPAPGPRQRPDGGSWDNSRDPHTLTAWARWAVAAEAVERHLPPGFTPDQPSEVLLEVRRRRFLPWLAGRGYNIVVVSLAALAANGEPGRLQAVVWESLPDAVLTGREDLGIPKLWAEVSDLAHDELTGKASASASWDGFTFLHLRVRDLVEDAPDERHDVVGPPYFQWRYLPRPGSPGQSEASYPTRTPGAVPDRRVQRSWRGTATVEFARASFEQLPTMFHVVNGLAGLAPGGVCTAGLIETVGSRDLSDHRPLVAEEVQP